MTNDTLTSPPSIEVPTCPGYSERCGGFGSQHGSRTPSKHDRETHQELLTSARIGALAGNKWASTFLQQWLGNTGYDVSLTPKQVDSWLTSPSFAAYARTLAENQVNIPSISAANLNGQGGWGIYRFGPTAAGGNRVTRITHPSLDTDLGLAVKDVDVRVVNVINSGNQLSYRVQIRKYYDFRPNTAFRVDKGPIHIRFSGADLDGQVSSGLSRNYTITGTSSVISN